MSLKDDLLAARALIDRCLAQAVEQDAGTPLPARDAVGQDGRCPRCREKAARVRSNAFGASYQELCTNCGFDYGTRTV